MIQLTRQFALFKQTILNDTRSLGMQILRFAFISVLSVIFISVAMQVNSWGRNLDGRYFFESIFVINLFFVVGASIFLFLPIVREEKEENTLGMILMTGISPFAYLFGKVGSRFLMMTLMMAIQIPITYLCITMGGISTQTIFYSYLLLLMMSFFLGNLFLLSSLIGSSIFSCLFISSAVILAFCYFVNYVLGDFYNVYYQLEPFRLFELSLREIFGISAKSISGLTKYYLLSLLLGGIFFFSLAVYFFNALTGDQKEINLPKKFKGEATSKQKAESYSGKGVKTFIRKLKTRRFAKNPIIYKDFRFSSFGPHLYLLQFLSLVVCCTLFTIDHIIWRSYRGFDIYEIVSRMCRDSVPFFAFTMFTMIMLSSYLVFSQEIKNNTLNTLKVLPEKASRIFRDKTLCVLRVSAPSIIIFLIFFTIYSMLRTYLSTYYYNYGSKGRMFKELYLCIVLIIPGFFMNSWLSMAFKKYAFFLANGLTFAVFAVQFMFFDLLGIHMDEGLWILTFTGTGVSIFAYLRALKILKAE